MAATYDVTDIGEGTKRYDHPNRKLVVIVTPVTTANGEVYNCVLHESEKRYGTPKYQITSDIAHTREEVRRVVDELFAHA